MRCKYKKYKFPENLIRDVLDFDDDQKPISENMYILIFKALDTKTITDGMRTAILKRTMCNYTFKEVADSMGISIQRARELYQLARPKVRRSLKRLMLDYTGNLSLDEKFDVLDISYRTTLALYRGGISTIKDVKNMLLNSVHVRGIGDKSINELICALMKTNLLTKDEQLQIATIYNLERGEKDD